ncbi:50S ribosomal protein L32e [Candidatus Bathyarchaeota archaeon]|nr:50S ribosomal protein L32e [Candidatus Bathyarchaeota archaeon]
MTKNELALARKAVEIRKRVKGRKPEFVRQESWRYIRLKENWRRPKGLDNKMRRKIKGWPVTVNVGYRGPKNARGLHPSGYREVLIHNLDELKKVNPKIEAVRIAHNIGGRKRAKILVEAKKRGITVLNFKEVEKEKEKEKTEETEIKEEKPKKKSKKRKRAEENAES